MTRAREYRRIYKRLETDAEYRLRIGMHDWFGIREFRGESLDSLAERHSLPQRRIVEVVE